MGCLSIDQLVSRNMVMIKRNFAVLHLNVSNERKLAEHKVTKVA